MNTARLFHAFVGFPLVLAVAAGCRSTPPPPAKAANTPSTSPAFHNVRNFGAKGDGVTKDTAAFQAALDLCAANGGGTVIVPGGIYLIGSIVISPNTTLQLDRANLIGSPDIADYPLAPIRWEGEFRDGHRALIFSDHADNVVITGTGAICGPSLAMSHRRNPRGPALIELANGANVTLNGFSTLYQNLWSIHLLFCHNVTARNLTIRTILTNGDGIDVDSCDGVTIERCDINTGDDAISLKSGRGLAALNLNRPTQNVVIRNCTLASSLNAGVGIGTEISGGIRDVLIQNCTLSGRQNGIFLKSREGRGGFMDNITGTNLLVINSGTFLGIDLITKGISATDPVTNGIAKWTEAKNISFNHVKVSNVQALVTGSAVPKERPMNGLTFSDITGDCKRSIVLSNIENAKFDGINVTGFTGALFRTNNVQLAP